MTVRTWIPIAALAVTFGSPAAEVARAQTPADPRALEIARRSLDAVREGWALGRYDDATRVRAAVNVRGAGAQGVTANLVLDRSGPRGRLDTAGGVGPLTVWAGPDRLALHVPALEQYATRSAGGLAALASQWGRLDAEVVAMRARLDEGYGNLSLAGEESIDGRATWRLDDRPEPGTTTSYWIDQGTHLPRRIAIDRPGRRDVRIDLAYGSGPRPSRAVAYLQGQRDVQLTLSPAFERTGRISRIQIVTESAGSPPVTIDVTFDWAPRIGAEFLRFSPPAGAREVPFAQLTQGVLLMAAGALGGLMPLFLGAR